MPLPTLLICTLLVATQVPARPDFTGEWVLDPAKTTSTGAPMRVGGPGVPGVPGGATVTEPRKIKNVPPVYPVQAQQARIGGRIILEAIIDRQGKVSDLKLIRSVPELDRAAMEAVSKWEYTPTLLGGVPIEVIMTVTVTFSIDGASPQMGRPVPGAAGSPWPSQPAGAARPGMGRGFTAPVILIRQDERELILTRKFEDASELIRYRFDGTASKNHLPGTGGALDNTYTYVSRWDGDKLVSAITWNGPQGARQRTETISIEGNTLTIKNARPTAEGAEPFITTNVFTRKR